jgi:hypothetical protein
MTHGMETDRRPEAEARADALSSTALVEITPREDLAPTPEESAPTLADLPVIGDEELEQFYADRMTADARLIRKIISILSVAGSIIFTFVQVHPEKIFTRNTPTGGDMGAHVWAPAFMRDHLLPHFRLQGWTMDWYAGFPAYRFYMVPPALLIDALNGLLHIPYGVAFKMVVVLGLLTLPLNAWAYGRLAKLAWPIPELLAFGAVMFLFDENFTIYGGNIASTMAGEFSFSIALSLALLGLGLLHRGMREGKGLGMSAAVLALAAVTHGIVAIFVGLGAVVTVLLWIDIRDHRRLAWGGATLGTFGLLVAWWILPFHFTTQYMTNMKYEPYEGPIWKFFNPQSQATTLFLLLFAVIGFVASVVKRNRAGAFLGITFLLWIMLVSLARKPLPIVGDLFWNYRGLPFIYLCRYLLAMIGVGETILFTTKVVKLFRDERVRRVEVGSLEWSWWQRRLRPERIDFQQTLVTSGAVALVGLLSIGWIAFSIDRLPLQGQNVYVNGAWYHKWGPIKGKIVNDGTDSDGWAFYNFKGYEGRDYWNEYRDLMLTSQELGTQRGCGRAMWEHQADKYDGQNVGSYGTPMALMLLPFWTDGCVASMEGLYFESSGTTPYHFLTASAVSDNASDPVRELRYDRSDLDVGVPYMRDLGVRYYYAFTPHMVELAEQRTDLTEVATSGPWHIFEVQGWSLVVPLTTQPLVVEHRGGDQRERWLEVGTSYFQNPEDWGGLLVADGPKDWQRISVEPDPQVEAKDAENNTKRVDVLTTETPYETRQVPSFTIDPNTVTIKESSISFDVPESAIGQPVLVRVSYFPNWKVSGAKGPYRAAPNFMVVIPTSTHVKLHYGYSHLDLFSYFLTFAGIGLLVFFWRKRVVDFDSPLSNATDPS